MLPLDVLDEKGEDGQDEYELTFFFAYTSNKDVMNVLTSSYNFAPCVCPNIEVRAK